MVILAEAADDGSPGPGRDHMRVRDAGTEAKAAAMAYVVADAPAKSTMRSDGIV